MFRVCEQAEEAIRRVKAMAPAIRNIAYRIFAPDGILPTSIAGQAHKIKMAR
jgi:hypothetical protein